VNSLWLVAGVAIAPALNAQSSDWLNRLERINTATVQLIVSDSYTCTGALINNTKEQGRPLIVTAAHCLDGVEDLDSMLVLFGKRKLLQDQPFAGLEWRSKGVSVLASSEGIDFALLELKSSIPDFVAPLYLGWGNSDAQPEVIYSIHSPDFGDTQYSFSLAKPLVATFGGLYKAIDSGHWRVDKWTQGSTSPGSSGAPLLDENFSIIGGLSGSTDWPDYKSDYFFRFDLAYDHFGNKNKQLKAWIDPRGSGASSHYQLFHKVRNYEYDSPVLETMKLVNSGVIKEEFALSGSTRINGVYITVGETSGHPDSQLVVAVSSHDVELTVSKIRVSTLSQLSENYIAFEKPVTVSGEISISLKWKPTDPSVFITMPSAKIAGQASYFFALNSSKSQVNE